jgi:NADH dehydrogenase/NADH:ubiquinone oxidoreductase subunit G
MTARFVRLAETHRAPITIIIDGKPVQALQGDTLLVAMLSAMGHVRTSEFGDGPRAGFCMMGACQDCWVWTTGGERLRACSTPLTEGLSISTEQPEAAWPDQESSS